MPLQRFTFYIFASLLCAHATAQDANTALPLDFNAPPQLDNLVSRAVRYYPSVQAARSDRVAADQEIDTAQLKRLPTVTWQNENNFKRPASQLRIQQPLWANGKYDAQVSQAEQLALAAEAKLREQQYTIGLKVVSAWQSWISAGVRRAVQERALTTLKQYEAQMQRRVEAQVSPSIDLEQVRSRMLQTQADVQSLQTSERIAASQLSQLSGGPISDNGGRDIDLLDGQGREINQALKNKFAPDWQASANSFPSVQRADFEALAAEERMKITRAEGLPQLYVRYQREFGPNKLNLPDNHVWVGFQYTPGAGFSTLFEARAAATRVEALKQTRDATRLEIQDSLQNDWEELNNTNARGPLLQSSVNTARAVVESYERQFVAGRRSWLEVLNAARELTQAESSLAENRSTLVAIAYRLRLRMGQHTWQ